MLSHKYVSSTPITCCEVDKNINTQNDNLSANSRVKFNLINNYDKDKSIDSLNQMMQIILEDSTEVKDKHSTKSCDLTNPSSTKCKDDFNINTKRFCLRDSRNLSKCSNNNFESKLLTGSLSANKSYSTSSLNTGNIKSNDLIDNQFTKQEPKIFESKILRDSKGMLIENCNQKSSSVSVPPAKWDNNRRPDKYSTPVKDRARTQVTSHLARTPKSPVLNMSYGEVSATYPSPSTSSGHKNLNDIVVNNKCYMVMDVIGKGGSSVVYKVSRKICLEFFLLFFLITLRIKYLKGT